MASIVASMAASITASMVAFSRIPTPVKVLPFGVSELVDLFGVMVVTLEAVLDSELSTTDDDDVISSLFPTMRFVSDVFFTFSVVAVSVVTTPRPVTPFLRDSLVSF